MTTLDIERITCKSGDITIKINGFFLHSKYDPLKEAEQFVDMNYKPNHLHILYGYGNGYFYKKFKEKLKSEEELLIIDPIAKEIDIECYKEIITDIYEKKNLNILDKKIDKFNRRVNIIISPNYDKVMEEDYVEFLKLIKDRLNINRVTENTVRFFSEIWQKNYLLNLYYTTKDKSLIELKNKYNLPVVIASGGPSLTKQIPILQKIKDSVIILAAGSTINTLLKNGIEPNYVVSVDGSDNNYNHFRELNLSNTGFIYSLYSHYKIRKSFGGNGYIFDTTCNSVVNKHLTYLTNEIYPSLIGGGSVANYAFTVANYISSGPIALIGQDLAYTDNKTHAEFNKNYLEIDEDFRKKRGAFLTEGYFGEEVLTDYVFYSMKESFEKLITFTDKNRTIYNCTEGGVFLKGFTQISFQEFCNKYAENIEYCNFEKSCISSTDIMKKFDLKDKMEKELKHYSDIKKILTESLDLISKNKSKIKFEQKTIKLLNKNDEKLKKIYQNVSIISLIDPITLNIKNNYLPNINESSKEKYIRVYNQNQELYSSLAKVIDIAEAYTNELIMKIIKDIEDENHE
ncbi:motility associated factor glycosyltransferase family protein [Psychrobacillus sp. Sa2BUA9]|uniref:Motility associated factor glycosyltransferase family protein n=1 Tax=Psychrobacillus faecigallinarum TaxID=2762235 RepID=A0ABR8R5J0_9BACI|nr:6-hydroxymethylpterin diphosphokinase MptE-like protein [Psychrobacillus faecigallinarum]MBD7943039.1 motility associated factor glycosyltransferase family protein [Psychrobacillus faecigallinarum]